MKVRQLPGARNPIFVKGRPATDFEIVPGEHFVIGETTFTLTDERVNVSLDVPQPVQQQTFSSQYLQKMQFRHTGAHIDVLGTAARGDRRRQQRFGAFRCGWSTCC